MNAFLIQSLDGVAENSELMSVESQLLNAQNNRPVMGIVQDALVGSWLMTSPSTFLEREDIMNLVMVLRYPLQDITQLPGPAVVHPRPLWTGKQVFSLLIPKITYRRGDVYIYKGELLRGRLDKSILGSSGGGLIHAIAKLKGNRAALNFMTDCQLLINAWMEGVGLSIGIEDFMLDDQTNQQIQWTIRKTMQHADRVYKAGKELGLSFEKRERHVSGILSKLLDITGGMAQKQLDPEKNALMAIVTSGAKGNKINVAQITACVGQQSNEGHRMYRTANPQARNLAAFEHGDESVLSRGFIPHSYMQGLSPTEFFFHLIAGREGLVDTSVKTADTGYIQRKLTKALESFNVAYDGTVRNATKGIIDYVYGGDNCDAQYLEKVTIQGLTMSLDELNADLTAPELDAFLPLREKCLSVKFTLFVQTLDSSAYLPFNLPLLLDQFDEGKCHVGPEEWCNAVTEFVNWLKRNHAKSQTLYLRASLVYHLRYSNVSERDVGLPFLEELRRTYQKCLIQAGEAVGVLAAESVGHPCTQLTLNSLDYEERVIVRDTKTGEIWTPKIGEFVDGLFKECKDPSKVTFYPENGTEYLDTKHLGLEVPDISKRALLAFHQLEAVTRHPPPSDTKLMKVTTASGRSIVATPSKSFLQRRNNEIVTVPGSELKVGDYFPVMVTLPEPSFRKTVQVDPLTAFRHGQEAARLGEFPTSVLGCELVYLQSFSEGFWDIYVNNKNEAGDLSSESVLAFALAVGTFNDETWILNNGTGLQFRDLVCNDVIPGCHLQNGESGDFHRLLLYYKNVDENPWISDLFPGNVKYDPIVSIEHVASTTPLVYDFTVAETRNFIAANGMAVADTFHGTFSSQNFT